ncbi:neck protein [Vibrio phage LV6]|nr:neck protein [Vibrio phage LV6]
MISLTIDSKDILHQLADLFEGVEEALDPEEILDDAATILLSRITRRFRAQVSPDGTKWQESNAAMIRRLGGYTWSNGKKWTGGHTLFASGRLFRSFDIRDDGIGQRTIINPTPYAIYVNGIYNGRWRFMGAAEQDIQLILNMVQDRLNNTAAGISR